MQIGIKYGGINAITLEAAAQIKRSAATQDTANDGHVQVDASSDMRKMLWLFASGAPDTVAYKNYGNLGKRISQVS